MRIECVGGGPAGLYFALLMKLRDPRHDITVFERGSADSTYGWGVTLGKDVLDILRRNDPESAQEIDRAGFRWRKQVVYFEGTQAVYNGNDVYNIGRRRLVDILAARARELGVDIRYGHEVLSPDQLADADLVVAADGASSRIRHAAGKFQTDIIEGSNKYIWLGTTRAFDRFNYLFTRTDAGWVWAFAYGFAPELSTFIVECAPETWDGLGFATMPADESLALLESLFKTHLDGHRLIGRFPGGASVRWQNYRTVTNQRWHDGNIVLLGDSAHTAHFSIGHGTKLAFDDAITLADSLGRSLPGNMPAALQAYESQRRVELMRPLSEARCSAQWFESLPRYTSLKPQQFAALLQLRRSPLIPVLPPWLAYLLHQATEQSAVLGGIRGRLGPAAKIRNSRRARSNGTLREGCDLGLVRCPPVRQSRQKAASLEVPMSLTHSPDTHKSLIARIPFVTGRELAEWFTHLESGPAFLRREERANWLADEHGICDRYATAIVHEYEIRRRLRLFGG